MPHREDRPGVSGSLQSERQVDRAAVAHETDSQTPFDGSSTLDIESQYNAADWW